MAAMLTTRHWESDESIDKIKLQDNFHNKFVLASNQQDELEGCNIDNSNNPARSLKRKAPANTVKGGKIKTGRGINDIVLEHSNVKASALLYEITERTNKLAQPRVRIDGLIELKSKMSNAVSIPKASPRIIELAKPRVPFHSPPKKVGHVSPGALNAIASQRIIELSKPKKKRRLKVTKKVRPKSHREKSARLRRSKQRSRRGFSFRQRASTGRSRSVKSKSAKSSGSDRSIIMVGLKLKDKSRS